jgi:beta-glucosidase-like glycosyl hydrolase
MKQTSIFLCFVVWVNVVFSQAFLQTSAKANAWVDSVFNTLTPQQKVAQLMIIRAHSNLGQEHINQVTELIAKYNVGGLCFFQGGPLRQAKLTNYYQQIAKTPLLIAIDAEWGLGMRLDSVTTLPKQLMLGATKDSLLVYNYGKVVANQCKRLGIHINYAPVVDVNNNAANPVINDRSFGEDKYTVAALGIAYMNGLQENGIMACAKHFPGHGDVAVDSHYDLPVINKSIAELDSVELYPFKRMIEANVGSIMIAHLYIPAIDTSVNRATSLSKNNVTNLLKNKLQYKGLIFTDALEMQGVTKFFPAGDAALQSIIAGNDMLCLPSDIPNSINKILAAVNNKEIDENDLNQRVKKVLLAKYNLGLHHLKPIDTMQLIADLNKEINQLRLQVSKSAITLVKCSNRQLFANSKKLKVAYVGFGTDRVNSFAAEIKEAYNAKLFLFNYTDSTAITTTLKKIKRKYKTIIVGVHNYSRKPVNNFGLSNMAINAINYLGNNDNALVVAFGNPYAIANFAEVKNLLACYEDDTITQLTAAQIIQHQIKPKGSLPVTVTNNLPLGTKRTLTEF